MEDFFRFIRLSSTRLFGAKRASRITFGDQRPLLSESKDTINGVSNLNYVIIPCKHVPDSKWDNVWREQVETKMPDVTGFVFLNPNFARSYYVPLAPFRCDFEEFTEYHNISIELMTLMKNGRYDRWMQAMIRSDACYVPLHVCSAAQLLDKFCSRCPKLARISLHYYYLDDNLVSYIVRNLSNVVSINFENSIGLSSRAYANLGLLHFLAHLNLSGSDISESNLNRILENCRQLESLNVSNNCAITGHCLTHRRVKNLKRLNIRDCWGINSAQLIEMTKCDLSNLLELLCNAGVSDESLQAIAGHCTNLLHLDISFEEFTYHDDSGYNLLTDQGFAAIAQLTNLCLLRLRHIGKLSDTAFLAIISSCHNLTDLTLNLRHRHKLTDHAMNGIAIHCPRLKYFEAVHNHFIGKCSVDELAACAGSLQCVILRGDELVQDGDAARLVRHCSNLRMLSLDGCREVADKTLAECILHARNLPVDLHGTRPDFVAGLVCTAVDRVSLNDLQSELPSNLRIRASNQRCNKVHYNEFDGTKISEHSLRDMFFPFYWHDFN